MKTFCSLHVFYANRSIEIVILEVILTLNILIFLRKDATKRIGKDLPPEVRRIRMLGSESIRAVSLSFGCYA